VNGLYPIQRRQRKPGAFPAAEALRAAKAASVVLTDSHESMPVEPPAVLEPVNILPPEELHEDTAEY
jgi:hypothetical protein